MEYKITIMEPDEKDVQYQFFEGRTPFMAINKGDLITYTAPHFNLRVTEVIHQLWEVGGVTKHHIIVYTELIDHSNT